VQKLRFVTFTVYSKLDADAAVRQTEVDRLIVGNAEKDRKIEQLKEQIARLQYRDDSNTQAMSKLEARLNEINKQYEPLTSQADRIDSLQEQIKALADKMGLKQYYLFWQRCLLR
jgi:predicted RNase H-like nuclease (RuvC/YqgF family)